MKTRLATILSSEDLGAAGTKIIDINLSDVISRIDIRFRAINGADNISAHPAANLTKIELVDGSDVLFSLNGHQAQAVNFFDRGRIPYSGIYTYDTAGCTIFCGLDFGRYLFDRTLAFDPKKFRNPQLKITFDEDICNTSCTENYCEVLAHIFDEDPPEPSGFLQTKEIFAHTVGESGYEYLDLPTDFVIQQIYAKCLLANHELTEHFDEFRLSEDNERRIPLDIESYRLQSLVFQQWGFVEEHAKLAPTANPTNFYGMPTGEAHAMGSCEGAEEEVSIWSNGGGQFGYEGAVGTYRARAKLIGYLPHSTIPLLPKPAMEIENWWDVTVLGSLTLRMKESTPAGETPTGEVFVNQYRPY